ncbi:hypothetical protein BC834DRAFT_319555 [Gloeopeniophorella convolvens]|nr:hypothetical protein BC834DRAFT_319555 [Gloeopeniophorella convolvens]
MSSPQLSIPTALEASPERDTKPGLSENVVAGSYDSSLERWIEDFTREEIGEPHELSTAGAFPGLDPLFNSVPRTPDIRSKIYAVVQKKLDAARLRVSFLSSRLNTLVPIALLPPELLTLIFHYHALIEPPFKRDRRAIGWIVDTHVCRQWRRVALSNASLWGGIDPSHPNTRWTNEMLNRVQGAPVDFESSREATPATFSLISQHLHHTRQLCLRTSRGSQSREGAEKLLSLVAPTLERFELQVKGLLPETFSLPADLRLFGGQAPRLSKLSIYNLPIPWLSFPQCPLSHLEVVLPVDGFTAQDVSMFGPLDHLIAILVGCPALETLILEYCMGRVSTQFMDQCQPISLPMLQVLSLVGSSTSVAHILGSMKLPSSTRIRLNCISEDSAGTASWNKVVSCVAAHFGEPETAILRSFGLEIVSPLRRRVHVKASSALPRSTFYPSDMFEDFLGGSSELSLTFDARFESKAILADITQQICAALPIADIGFLSLSTIIYDMANRPNWAELFQRCVKVSVLEIMGEAASALLRTINPPKSMVPPKTGKSRGQSRLGKGKRPTDPGIPQEIPVIEGLPFPCLKSLLLSTLGFEATVPGSAVRVGDLVKNLILRRKRCRVPLEVLGINECIISSEAVDTFGPLVPNFDWDGYEGESDYVMTASDDSELHSWSSAEYDVW